MTPLLLVPAAVFSFLGGIALGKSRRGLSMLPPGRGSPLPGVPLAAWERFVTVMVVAPRGHRGPRGRMGYFGLDARRLADVGFMRRPRKTEVGGESGVWAGEWAPPLSEGAYLGSAAAQYEALSRSMRDLSGHVAPLVGRSLEGERASLSGLLGAAHLAGRAGVLSWAGDPEARKKFRGTTASYHRTNGIF